jgi:hypothetical protein
MNIRARKFYVVDFSLAFLQTKVGDPSDCDKTYKNSLKFKLEQAHIGRGSKDHLRIIYEDNGLVSMVLTLKEAERIFKLNKL